MVIDYSWQDKVILLVEDDAYSILLLKSILASTGAKLLIANDGETAVRMARDEGNIDMVLMDIRLRGVSGLEATTEIKKFAPSTPIIAQTACAMTGDMERCIDAGCNAYLAKPLEVNTLLEVMNRFFSMNISKRVKGNELVSN